MYGNHMHAEMFTGAVRATTDGMAKSPLPQAHV